MKQQALDQEVRKLLIDNEIRMRSANLSRLERIQRTRHEKHIYLPLQFRSDVDTNKIYECETQARQHVLYHITPFLNDIVGLYLCRSLFHKLYIEYPSWIENIFTRKSAKSNEIMLDIFTSTDVWDQNDWRNKWFRRFCRVLRGELSPLFKALGIPHIDVSRMSACIREVTRVQGLLQVTDSELGRIPHLWVIGFWFGKITDDDVVLAEDYWAD